MTVHIGTSEVGNGAPVYVIAGIGLNHNGSVETAVQLIDVAADAGAQAVKFQKRTPEISTPEHMKNTPRDTPWGPSVDFLEDLNVVAHKVASASVTDLPMLESLAQTGKPIILSTGMSTLDQIDRAVEVLGTERLVILHATSTYPLPAEEANLRTITTLQQRYAGVPIGYSGHERGLQISIAAVALGAVAVERHITLDRTMWGSDHAASLEPQGFEHLVPDIRVIGEAMGDEVKRVFPGELAPLAKLRRVPA
jgi:N-acetylneuraminate synthase